MGYSALRWYVTYFYDPFPNFLFSVVFFITMVVLLSLPPLFSLFPFWLSVYHTLELTDDRLVYLSCGDRRKRWNFRRSMRCPHGTNTPFSLPMREDIGKAYTKYLNLLECVLLFFLIYFMGY